MTEKLNGISEFVGKTKSLTENIQQKKNNLNVKAAELQSLSEKLNSKLNEITGSTEGK